MLRGKIPVVHFRLSSVAKNHEAICMELQKCDLNSRKAARLKREIRQTVARQTAAANGRRLRASVGREGAPGSQIQRFADCRREQQGISSKRMQAALKTKGKYGAGA